MGAYMTREDRRRWLAAQAHHRQMLALPQLNTRHFDNAYVVEDSLDAGRTWNQVPPSLAGVSGLDELDCIPSGDDRRGLGRVAGLDCIPPGEDRQGLGQFAAIIAPIIGAVIQSGATIGGAMIAAKSAKYAIRQQTKTDLQIALARAHSELEQTKATTEAQVEIARESTKQKTVEVAGSAQQVRDVSSSVVPIVGILGAGALVAWIMLKD